MVVLAESTGRSSMLAFMGRSVCLLALRGEESMKKGRGVAFLPMDPLLEAVVLLLVVVSSWCLLSLWSRRPLLKVNLRSQYLHGKLCSSWTC